MHPLTRFFNFLKHKDFSMALVRQHIADRDLTNWYPEWMYELMETDEVRNQCYQDAIQEMIAGKVVLELGTGRKALWAVRCVRAGAKRVYAIEANQRAYQSSLDYLRTQGIDNVHLICGFSDRVELPERCEVLVHDLVGDIGSSEGMVQFVEDAKRRLLVPDAIHIPERCTTYAVLAEEPQLHPAEWTLSYVIRECQAYDGLAFVRFFGFPPRAALSEPQVFEDIVFREPPPLENHRRLLLPVERDGDLRGVLLFIRLHFGAGRVVDTWASQTTWATPFIRMNAASPVKAGDLIEMNVDSDLSGNPSYSIRLAHVGNGSLRAIGEYAWTGD